MLEWREEEIKEGERWNKITHPTSDSLPYPPMDRLDSNSTGRVYCYYFGRDALKLGQYTTAVPSKWLVTFSRPPTAERLDSQANQKRRKTKKQK